MSTQDAQLLLRRYLAGECTAEEKELLEAWWNELQLESAESAESVGSVASPASERSTTPDKSVHDRMLSRIKAELGAELEPANTQTNAPVILLNWRRYAGIAAAILVITAGGWFWAAHNRKPPEDAPITIEAKPGTDRAILVLADGKAVVLDSLANGVIAIQEKKIIKQDGQLDYQREKQEENIALTNILETPTGSQYKLILADGTKVWLDAASSITYPTAFLGKTRQVSVTGQVYFEVAHQANFPFEVKVQGQVIRDIGTAFNVYAYADESTTKITLASGVVDVSGPGKTMVRINQPGQQAEYKNGELQKLREADLASALAWKNGLFSFSSANITTVMRQVGRWYDVDIQFEKGSPEGHITGEVPRNTMLSTALQVLRISGVHFTTEGKTIHVMP